MNLHQRPGMLNSVVMMCIAGQSMNVNAIDIWCHRRVHTSQRCPTPSPATNRSVQFWELKRMKFAEVVLNDQWKQRAWSDPGILEGGFQGPRKGRSVGIFMLTSQQKKLWTREGLPPPPPNPLDPPLDCIIGPLDCIIGFLSSESLFNTSGLEKDRLLSYDVINTVWTSTIPRNPGALVYRGLTPQQQPGWLWWWW